MINEAQWTRGQYGIFIALNLLPMILVWLYPLKWWMEMNRMAFGSFVDVVATAPAVLIFLIGPAWAIAGIVLLFRPGYISRGLVMILSAVLWWVCLFGANALVDHVRLSRLMDAGVDAKPLIAAIRQYEADKGVAPDYLSDLVPGHMGTVPGTGIPVYPDFEYRKPSWTSPNKWEMSISTGFGMSFDQFIYLPEGNYPSEGYGGALKAVGDWAYVYE